MNLDTRRTAALRLGTGLVAALLAAAATAGLGAWSLAFADARLHAVYHHGSSALASLSTIELLAARDRVALTDAVLHADPAQTALRLGEYRARRAQSAEAWQQYRSAAVVAEDRAAADEVERTLKSLVDGGLAPTAVSLDQGDYADARRRLDDGLDGAALRFARAIGRMKAQQARANDLARAAADAENDRVRLLTAATTAAGIASWVLLALGLGRRATRTWGDGTQA